MTKSLLMILFSISVAVVGQLFLKAGMDEIGPITLSDTKNGIVTLVKVATNGKVVLGLAIYALSAGVWLIVLSRVDLSFAYPLIGFSYIVVMLASRSLFNEPISAVRWAGAILISIGVVFISRT